MIDSHRTQGEWKAQLTMRVNFFSSKDSEEFWMYNSRNNKEILTAKETDEISKKLFDSFLQRYQDGLE